MVLAMRSGAAGSGGGWCGTGRACGDGGGVERLVGWVGLREPGESQGLGGLRVEFAAAGGGGLGAGGVGGLAGLHLLGDGGVPLAGAGEVLGVFERSGELVAGGAGSLWRRR